MQYFATAELCVTFTYMFRKKLLKHHAGGQLFNCSFSIQGSANVIAEINGVLKACSHFNIAHSLHRSLTGQCEFCYTDIFLVVVFLQRYVHSISPCKSSA